MKCPGVPNPEASAPRFYENSCELSFFLAEPRSIIYDFKVSTSQIGVHLADHSFFPIFSDQSPGRRRVILSTSHTDQECVDIVLYRRDPEFSEGEERLGHVLLCDVSPGDPEQSEIELVLDLKDDGTIAASAIDRRSGNRRDVSIDQRDATPEFVEEDAYVAGDVRELVEEDKAPRRAGVVVAFILGILLIAAIGFLVWWFLLREEPTATAPRESDSPTEQSAADTANEDETVATAESADVAAGTQPAQSGESASADAVAPVETAESDDTTEPGDTAAPADTDDSPGETTAPETRASESSSQAYRVRWGDTLWDISRMFYGTPWRFRDIAEENRISNPDRIFAEDEITIP